MDPLFGRKFRHEHGHRFGHEFGRGLGHWKNFNFGLGFGHEIFKDFEHGLGHELGQLLSFPEFLISTKQNTNQNSDKDGIFKDLNTEFEKNFQYVIDFYETDTDQFNFNVEYVRKVFREQLCYPIGRQQCLIYMARLGFRLKNPKKQNLITFSARIKRLKVSL